MLMDFHSDGAMSGIDAVKPMFHVLSEPIFRFWLSPPMFMRMVCSSIER